MKYKSPTTAMRHQAGYLQKLKKRPKTPAPTDVMAVRGEMGTGKSKMILDEWQDGVAADLYDNLFVIAPSGSYRNWYRDKSDAQQAEIKVHLDPKLLANTVVAPWVTGGGVAVRDKIRYTIEGKHGKKRMMFMNIEALSTSDKALAAAVAFLKSGRTLLVIDESTKIKNGKADRTKTIIRSLKPLAAGRRIMSGLITPRSPFDLFWQFWFLDWRILGFETAKGFMMYHADVEQKCYLPNEKIRAKVVQSMGLRQVDKKYVAAKPEAVLRRKLIEVRKHFEVDHSKVPKLPIADVVRKLGEEAAIMKRDDMIDIIPKLGGYIQVVSKVKEYKNLPELYAKTEPYSHRCLKSECLDLKPKIFMPRDVELTDEQWHHYNEMKAKATTELESGDHVVSTAVIATMMRLHQIVCGHVTDEDGVIHDLQSNRVPAILDVLEEHGGKAIIWTTYQHEIKKIAAALREAFGSRSCALFYGGNKRTRDADESRFLGDAECKYMISTQSAGGIGNTWNVADLTIYAANNYDLELRAQSEDRNHRKGQTKSVTYVDMIARNTVEVAIIKSLRLKIDMFTTINGENYREWLI